MMLLATLSPIALAFIDRLGPTPLVPERLSYPLSELKPEPSATSPDDISISSGEVWTLRVKHAGIGGREGNEPTNRFLESHQLSVVSWSTTSDGALVTIRFGRDARYRIGATKKFSISEVTITQATKVV